MDEGIAQHVVDLISRSAVPVTIVAVDGHSAAGKSTVATELSRELDASLVRGDDFYRVMDPERRASLTAGEGVDLYYDWQRLRADAPPEWLDRWDAAERWYFEFVRVPATFDVTIAA